MPQTVIKKPMKLTTFLPEKPAVNAMSIVEWNTAQIRMLPRDELNNQVNKILPVSKLKNQPMMPTAPISTYPGL